MTEHCETCGTDCPVWYADHDRWNMVTANMLNGRASVLCPTCFAARWATVTGLTARWHLVPEDIRQQPVHYVCVARDEMSPPRAEPPVYFKGRIVDTGGGAVTIAVDRDTEHYPREGARVVVDELVA